MRGEVTQDLMVNPFKGYLTCSDTEFGEYIKCKQDMYEKGDELDPDLLMKNAADKYKTLLQKGQWNVPSASETKILALQSQIKQLKKKDRQGNKKPKDMLAKKAKEKPEWFNKQPWKSVLNVPKMWNGKPWYYCHPYTGKQCDGKHRLHHPSKCQGTKYRFTKFESNGKNDITPKKRNSDNGLDKRQKTRALELKDTLRAEAVTLISKEDDGDMQRQSSSESE